MTKLPSLAALAVGAMVATGASAQNVGIAASVPGSLFHNIATAVANAANKEGLNATIQSATSSNQYLPFVGAGGIEFGVANLQEVAYAMKGEEWFDGQASPNLRIVANIMPLREAIFVRADSGIRTIADLKGKRMTDGYTAQQTIIPQLDALYATAGMTRDDVEQVNVPNVVAGTNAFIAGESDGFIFAHGAGKVREADAAVGGLYAIPVEPTDENLKVAREHWPVAFFTKIEAGTTPGVTETAYYFAYPQVVFTHAGVSDDLVYAMAKALHDNKATLAESFKPFGAFNPADMHGETFGVPFHPGAEKYYQEQGM